MIGAGIEAVVSPAHHASKGWVVAGDDDSGAPDERKKRGAWISVKVDPDFQMT